MALKTHPDCKCGFWLNSGYKDCPLKECKDAGEWTPEKQRHCDEFTFKVKRIVLIDPEEKCILVENLTNKP